MSWRKLIGTPKAAKKTLKKIVREEIDNPRNDELARRRQRKPGKSA